jgi:uncharacterized protein YjbI with pentapeptide repeats
MNKVVLMKLGKGTFRKGFPATIQIVEEGNHILAEVQGELPPAPDLPKILEHWRSTYQNLGFSFRSLRYKEQVSTSILSREYFNELSNNLEQSINNWLDSQKFRPIKEAFLSKLKQTEEFRIIIQTENIQLRRIPWHLWKFFDDYSKAEIALGALNYGKIEHSNSNVLTKKVRILAVLGNSDSINLQRDRELLKTLPNTKIEFLTEPSRSDLDRSLWEEQGWDILFFAGHSYSQTDGKSGYLYINKTNKITINELKNALKASVERGLRIAIFNSCDGLGLAQSVADLCIPQVIVMREPVPDQVAQEFLKQFLQSFSSGKSLYISVREAREKLQGLENDFPCASWLPILFQNPAELPPTWQELCPGSFAAQQQAQEDYLRLSQEGVKAWNNWREKNRKSLELREIDLAGMHLAGMHLAGVNFSNVNLSGANLTGANLTGANLTGANLTGANLIATQVLDTNFEKALLTGACIKDWNINNSTNLTSVTCSYIYLESSKKERCPSSGEFKEGEFTKVFQKGKIENYLKQEYELELKAIEEKYQVQLQAKDEQITILRQKNAELIDIIKAMAAKPINIDVTAQAKSESESNTPKRVSNFNLQNSQFAGGLVDAETITANHIGGSISNYTSEERQTLAEAAAEIQQLLQQLEQTYPTTSSADKIAVVAKAINEIEKNSTLKARVIRALKASGTEAFKELIDHPLVTILITSIEGWLEAE